MAEAYLTKLGGDNFFVESAGLEPGTLNPHVMDALKEDGIDISGYTTDSVFNYFQEGRQYDIVVSVCSPEVDKLCPIFPGKTLRLNWPFPDPAQIQGNKDEILKGVRPIRDAIKARIESFIQDYNEKGLKLFLEEVG
jgi:arsenate reductase